MAISPPSLNAEKQLATLVERMNVALQAEDWPTLFSFDHKLQHALKVLYPRRAEPGIQMQLRQLNQLYTQMIAKAEQQKSELQRQISQQAVHREGMLAYLMNK